MFSRDISTYGSHLAIYLKKKVIQNVESLVTTHFTDYSSPLKCNSRLIIKKSSLFMAPTCSVPCSQVPAAELHPVPFQFSWNLCILFWTSVWMWVFCCQITSMFQASSSFHVLLLKCHVIIVSTINSTCHASLSHTNYICWKGIVIPHHYAAVFLKLLSLTCVEILSSVHVA